MFPRHELMYREQPTRIFVDGSHTLPSNLNSGVQRVVRNACEHIPALARDFKSEVIVSDKSGFKLAAHLQEDPAEVRLRELRHNILGHVPNWYIPAAKYVCRRIRNRKVKSWFLPQPGHQGIFKFPLNVYDRSVMKRRRPLLDDVGAGDMLVLPDAYWAHEAVWQPAARARSQGAFIVSVIYDLIPLTHPHFVAAGAPDSFRSYLQQAGLHSDLMVAISDTVRDEVKAALPSLLPGKKYCQDVRSFRLGAEFNEVGGTVRPHIQKIFANDAVDTPYLMVATFDPRKNHSYLLDAFDQIWARDGQQKLCLVGRIGWLCQDVVERVTSHPKFGQQLFMLNDVSDAELNHCYKKARAIIFPSIVEGFGLPIVEALWHGRYVFASDTPIHREVGGDDCCYCDLADPSSLAKQIVAWDRTQSPVSPVKPTDIKPTSWQQSMQSLLDLSLDSYANRKTKRRAVQQAA